MFPELFDGGYAALERGEGIHRAGDPFLERLRAHSRTAACTCVAGTVALRNPGGTITNTSLVFQRGRTVHRYDKIHMFRPTGDPTYFVPGTSVAHFSVPTGSGRVRAGVVVCYDLRFPELIRFLAQAGVEVLIVPARWPAVRDEAWRSLLKARAIENQMYVAGCNSGGEEGGASYVFDHAGAQLLNSAREPGSRSCVVDLDVGALRDARTTHGYLQDATLLKELVLPRTFRRRAAHPSKAGPRRSSARSRQ